MDTVQTISVVSKTLGISNRMLRYYEQIGLVESRRVEGYAYRVYDEAAICRIRQIVVLRKLRIPVKQIAEIFNNNNAACLIEIFERNIAGLDEDITALSTVRSILRNLVNELREKADISLQLDWLNDSNVVALIGGKEEYSMEELNKASETLNKLTDKDVRIVYLPPATVASIHLIGDRPEDRASAILRQFVETTGLSHVKPDFRHYGFNHPNGTDDDGHGYEYWVTIPEDMDLRPPFTKKRFAGGLYAAHTIVFGAFEEWHWLWEWVKNSLQFDFNLGDPECMDGCIEEHLNYFNQYNLINFDKDKFQMDLLIPIKERG